MADTHEVVTKVWIAPGCIVCDACENDCPEVFDVQEETCVIRPPALTKDFLTPLTPSIKVAAEGCPVNVIKFETVEAPGPAPWKDAPEGEPVAAAKTESPKHAPTAKAAPVKAPAPLAAADPKMQALISTSKISDSKSSSNAPIRKVTQDAEVVAGVEMLQALHLPKDAPADQRDALLAAAGGYRPQPSMSDRIRAAGAKAMAAAKVSRREFNFALAVAWGSLAIVGVTFGAMFQDFFGPKVLKEPKKVWRVGKLSDFIVPGTVNESYKRTPAGSEGFWLVNLQPAENKLVAISTICTHLGCIPNWLSGDQKFKCPCHGSGYYISGINFEGPTPRPLERFVITRDSEGYIVVDQRKVFRQELGEWEDPESFVSLS